MPRQTRGPQSARDSALRALARREHSAAELKRKLQHRGYSVDAAAQTVETLAQRGLQSDERFAGMLARSRAAQGYGPLRVEAELAAAGVSDAELAAALAAADCDWNERACAAQARRFKALPAAAADWQKQYRFLAARGFTPEQIRAALKGMPEE